MRHLGLFVVVVVAGCTTAELEPELGQAQQAVSSFTLLPIEIPTVEEVGEDPSTASLFGWAPDFPVNVPGFDSLNRAYLRDRTIRQNDIPGTMRSMSSGSWSQDEFEDAICDHFNQSAGCSVCYTHAGGWYSAQIAFDVNDNGYTVVQAKVGSQPCTYENDAEGQQFKLLMLRLDPVWKTWDVLQLPWTKRFAMERPWSPEPLEGPPAVLLWDAIDAAPCFPEQTATPGQYGILRVLRPGLGAQGLVESVETVLSWDALHVDSHSGGGTQVLTYNGNVYAVWGERTSPLLCESIGSPVRMARLAIGQDPGTGTYNLVEQQRSGSITFTRPTNDGHNRSALSIDTAGYIHLVSGAHNCPFHYLRSTNPEDVENWPDDPQPTFGDDDLYAACTAGNVPEPHMGFEARQTYAALVRDRFDTLHLVYRRTTDTENNYRLVYQRKRAGAAWEPPVDLVVPPDSRYATYYHQLTIDRYGKLYLLFSFYSKNPGEDPPHEWFDDSDPDCPGGSSACDPDTYNYSAMLISKSNGEDWATTNECSVLGIGVRCAVMASTADFDEATRWAAASAVMGDLDGNNQKDLVHVFYDQGLTAHIDTAKTFLGAWFWQSRGRRFTDGSGVLQYPVLSGNVNYPGDARDDLVFVFRHWATNALTIRTKFAQADGSFGEWEAIEPDGWFVPDTVYTNLVPLMGDVNADGKADLVFVYRRSCGLSIRHKLSNGNGTWSTDTQCSNHATYDAVNIHASLPHPPLLGKVDSDGDSDLVFVYRDPNGPNGVPGGGDDNYLATIIKKSYYNATSGSWDWTPGTRQWHSDGSGVHQYPHVMGDVNNDGRDDLIFLFRHWSTGQFTIRVKLAGTTGSFGTSLAASFAGEPTLPEYRPRVGDVNADGCDDIVLPYRDANDGQYWIRTFRSGCNGTTWTPTSSMQP